MNSTHAIANEEAAMTGQSPPRELAHRAADGVEVALLWYPGSDVTSVQVVDAKAGEAFELVLGHGDRPLDVFHHPYAYAALRGLDVGQQTRAPELVPAG
jgi:hypothetical protein